LAMRNEETDLTAGESFYLKELFRLEAEGKARVTCVSLAAQLGLKPASVSDMFSKLEEKELLEKGRWGPVQLSSKGVEVASALIWRHRVLETYFCSALSLNPDEACRAASHIDSAIPKVVVAAMCRTMNHPSACVHGYSIPHPEG